MLWGLGWNVWIPLGFAVLTLLWSWMEISTAKANERAAAQEEGEELRRQRLAKLVPGSATEFRVREEDGDEWYECTPTFQGELIRILISTHPKVYDKCLMPARELVSKLAELETRFEAFKHEQAARNQEWREEIEILRIGTIHFADWRSPKVAKVYFTEETGGDCWDCVLDGMEFRDLGMTG